MARVSKVAISLPEELLEAVEEERETTGETRSEFFRQAVVYLLKRRKVREQVAGYTISYQEAAETDEEVEAARRAAGDILGAEPWE